MTNVHSTPAPTFNFRLGVLCALLLLATVWVASQMGFSAAEPGKFAAVWYLVLTSLPALGAYWLGAAGLGWPLRLMLPATVHFPRLLQVALGLAAMMLLGYVAGALGLLTPITAWGLSGVGVVLLAAQFALAWRSGAGREPVRWPWTLPLLMSGLGLLITAGACPPGTLWRVEAYGYDVLSYHLQVPREWLAAGQMHGLEHNVYSYLPGLVESAYFHLSLMGGGAMQSIYLCQFMHVALAVLAAAGVACAAATFVRARAGAVAAATLLATPWVLVTGSLAYNEMGVLAFGAAAMVMLFDVASERWRGAIVIGVLSGAATLSKLTAGPMVALPIYLMLFVRLNHARRWRRIPRWTVGVRVALAAALAGLLTLSPYFIRNAAWTGNPVFPFAASVLGEAHWDSQLVERWQQAHGLDWQEADRGQAFVRQWLLNAGYGALGGEPTPPERHNIARFPTEGGLPVLWLGVFIAGVAAALRWETRRVLLGMLAMAVVQLVFWFSATHLQSRFLIPTLLPAGVILGIGLGRLEAQLESRRWWIFPALGVGLVTLLTIASTLTLWTQTRTGIDPSGRQVRLPVYFAIDALVDDAALEHPINTLLPATRTYLVADNSGLLYIHRPFAYHTPFDPSPLGSMIAQAEGDPARVNALLREAGLTHVWIGWSELDRLHATYGYDERVTREMLQRLITTGWQEIAPNLYRLP